MIRIHKEKENIFIQHALNQEEYKINNYKVDGYCKENNTVWEYNGCLWHGCIKCFKPSKINPVNKKLMAELYHNTYLKEKKIKEKGYNLITIWEHDYLNKDLPLK